MKPLKIRMYDEKYGTWVHDPLFIYPTAEIVKQGVVIQAYTGLKDKNGQEIYEGDYINFSIDCSHPLGDTDIVQWNSQCVHYNEKLACFVFGYKHEFQILDKIMPETIAIIGNIFDNPELKDKEQ